MSSWLKARDWASGVEYSSLFYSGLRSISLRRTRIRAQSAAPTLSPEKNLPRSSLSYFLRRGISTKSPPTSKEPSPPPSHAEKVVRPRPSSMFVSSTKELDELWVTGGTFLDGTNDRQESIQVGVNGMLSPIPNSADPSSPAPCPRSFYVNLKDSSPLPPKGESFLSLSNDPEAPYRPLPRRERPVSIHTMPLPSKISPHYRRDRRERFDPAWMLEESSPELEAQDDGENADVAEINLDGVSDWRQFHVDWLQDEPSVQMLTTLD